MQLSCFSINHLDNYLKFASLERFTVYIWILVNILIQTQNFIHICGVLGLVESSRDKKAVYDRVSWVLAMCVCVNSEFACCLCIKYTTFLATRNVIERPRPGRLEWSEVCTENAYTWEIRRIQRNGRLVPLRRTCKPLFWSQRDYGSRQEKIHFPG